MKIIYWTKDPAACNVVEQFKKFELDVEIIESEQSVLFRESIEEDADFFMVPSTHRSESGKSTLTLHATGNWGNAELGGREKELEFTWPAAIKVGLEFLKNANLPGYEVSLEVTHHGPSSIGKPLVFIEIGSGEEQWKDQKTGEVVAGAIKTVYEDSREFENYIGFGGPHYAPSFSSALVDNPDIAIGHIAPKYVSEFLNKEIIEQALKKSFANRALIDWKGIKSEARQKVISALEELGIDYKKTKDI